MEKISNSPIPRPEYPRPQFVRDGWMNLNGVWQFEIDQGCSGRARGLVAQEKLSGEIIVPFCPESRLSGVGHTDFMRAVWYKRAFALPAEAAGKRVFLRFGAVDYACEVWINGMSVGTHRGGYASFGMDITAALRSGENVVTVCAEDDTRDPMQPTGKQSPKFESFGCFYTRTTGIWQTVWLEWMNDSYLDQVFLTPDAANARLHIRAKVARGTGCALRAETSFAGKPTGGAQARVNDGWVEATVQLTEAHLWNVGDGKLYDLQLQLMKDGEPVDSLSSYFGLRSVGFDGMKFLVNGKPCSSASCSTRASIPTASTPRRPTPTCAATSS